MINLVGLLVVACARENYRCVSTGEEFLFVHDKWEAKIRSQTGIVDIQFRREKNSIIEKDIHLINSKLVRLPREGPPAACAFLQNQNHWLESEEKNVHQVRSGRDKFILRFLKVVKWRSEDKLSSPANTVSTTGQVLEPKRENPINVSCLFVVVVGQRTTTTTRFSFYSSARARSFRWKNDLNQQRKVTLIDTSCPSEDNLCWNVLNWSTAEWAD